MQSKYQDPVFAEYWNKRAGNHGEGFKRYLLDPIMLQKIGNLSHKTIMDLGCGNGYLASKLLEQHPKKIILMDISEHNISYAKEKTKSDSVDFIVADATKPWNIPSDSVDVVYSNMLFNEIENLKTPMEEAYRVLKNKGVFIFSVTHPAWDLFIYAQEKAGVPSKKIKGLHGYFQRGYAKYIMGSDSKTNPDLAKEYQEEFEVKHYHRPISDYFQELIHAGFTVQSMIEPELSKALTDDNPRFLDMKDIPISLIFIGVKNS